MTAYEEITCRCGAEVMLKPKADGLFVGYCPHCRTKHTMHPSVIEPAEIGPFKVVLYEERWNPGSNTWTTNISRYERTYEDMDDAMADFAKRYSVRPDGNGTRYDGAVFNGEGIIISPVYRRGRRCL